MVGQNKPNIVTAVGQFKQTIGRTHGFIRSKDYDISQDAKSVVVYNYVTQKNLIDSLTEVKKNRNIVLEDMENNQRQTYETLSELCYDTKNKARNFKWMYQQYDTCMLIRQIGCYGDADVELTMNALLVCHRAEAALDCKYDEKIVNRAIESLQSVKSIGTETVLDIENRLNAYAKRSSDIRELLKKYENNRPQDDASNYKKAEHPKKFCKEIQEGYSDIITDARAYPYLYDRIVDAMEAIYDNPCKSISKIIEKL